MFPEISLVLHAILFYTSKNPQRYAELCIGAVLAIFVSVILKLFMKNFIGVLPDYIVLRPKGAFGCNQMCKINNDGDVGMPSSHSMVAGYFAVKYNNPLLLIFAFARLGKCENPYFYHSISGCHTLPQVIVGIVLGMIIASIT